MYDIFLDKLHNNLIETQLECITLVNSKSGFFFI